MADTNKAVAAIKKLSTLSATDLQDSAVRKKALAQTQQLSSILQDPIDTATQLVFSPYVAIGARIAVDMDLFGLISQAREKTITTEELAQKSKGEILLISMVLRPLSMS